MPIGGVSTPDVDLDRLDEGAASLPVDQGTRFSEDFGHFDQTRGAMNAFVEDNTRPNSTEELSMTGPPTLSPDDLNARYGVDGYLRFNTWDTETDAAWRSAMAREHQFRDQVFAASKPNPLVDFGASLAGTLTDPSNIAIMGLTDGLGGAGIDLLGLGAGSRTALAVARAGRIANGGFVAGRTLLEGGIANAPFVAASAAGTNYAGDDYDMGDALRDLAAGAIFHSTLHMAGAGLKALRSRFADASPALEGDAALGQPDGASPVLHAPEAVDALTPDARIGAFVKAVEDATDDRPVDVGQYVARELEPPPLERLNEPDAASQVASFRPLAADVAVTPRGTEIPVRYGLAELADLTTSHTDDLQVNADYPPELQPRARERAGAQARNLQLEAELNPKLLLSDVGAGAGAPIVAPDGTVESGNGRTIALRRSAAKGGAAYGRYLAELKAAGFDVTGLKEPVLVRMRSEAMSGPARAALAREMNADVTERLSATEQASVDAARISDTSWGAVGPNEGPTTSRAFAREFIARVAPDQANTLAAADGTLSPEGARRIKAAVLARAYGDDRLVGQIFEGEEEPARQLGEALADAAPAWAAMRALAARGEIPPQLDLTPALTSAMDLVRFAKAQKEPLGRLLAERLGQQEMFGGESISAATEAFLRLFYRDEAMTKPLARERITAALRDYARQASAVEPGENLFGETPGEDTARQILANLNERFARNDPGDLDVRAPGRAASPAPGPPVIDLRPPGGYGEGRGRQLSPQGGDGAEGAGKLTGNIELGTAYLSRHVTNGLVTIRGQLGRVAGQVIGPAPEGLTAVLDRTSRKIDLVREVPGVRDFGAAHDAIDVMATVKLNRDRVEHVVVSPDLQGKGLGTYLLKLAEEHFPGTKFDTSADGDFSDAGAGLFNKFNAERAGAAETATRPDGLAMIAADPELKALAEATDQLAADHGIEAAGEPDLKQDPNTLAEAIRAAAVCVAEEGL